jgi:CO dehydrogenase nickel-insertion accessory protein CooC1
MEESVLDKANLPDELQEEVKLKSVYMVVDKITNIVTGLTWESNENTVFYSDIPESSTLTELEEFLNLKSGRIKWNGVTLVEVQDNSIANDNKELKKEMESLKKRINQEVDNIMAMITDILISSN